MHNAGPICGATLIGPKTIISLAVCFSTNKPSLYSFKIGSVDLNTIKNSFKITKIYYYPCAGTKCFVGRLIHYNLAIATLQEEVNSYEKILIAVELIFQFS